MSDDPPGEPVIYYRQMTARVRMRVTLVLAVAASCGLLLAGCATSTQPPPKLSVSVFQYRSDYAPRQAQIEVHNLSAGDITVTSARFASDWFASSVGSRSAPSHVDGHATVDFPVVLSAARCSSTAARPSVTITWTTKSGSRGRLTTTPGTPFDSLAAVHGQDCGRAAFEKVATITLPTELRIGERDGKPLALVDLMITPTGAPGTVTLLSTEDTTLLAQPEGTIRTFDRLFSASSAAETIVLDYVPSRCEPHVIGEDKVGTLIPLRVDAAPFSDQEFSVPVSPAVKEQIYRFWQNYCGE